MQINKNSLRLVMLVQIFLISSALGAMPSKQWFEAAEINQTFRYHKQSDFRNFNRSGQHAKESRLPMWMGDKTAYKVTPESDASKKAAAIEVITAAIKIQTPLVVIPAQPSDSQTTPFKKNKFKKGKSPVSVAVTQSPRKQDDDFAIIDEFDRENKIKEKIICDKFIAGLKERYSTSLQALEAIEAPNKFVERIARVPYLEEPIPAIQDLLKDIEIHVADNGIISPAMKRGIADEKNIVIKSLFKMRLQKDSQGYKILDRVQRLFVEIEKIMERGVFKHIKICYKIS
jgi:hypothetical protein